MGWSNGPSGPQPGPASVPQPPVVAPAADGTEASSTPKSAVAPPAATTKGKPTAPAVSEMVPDNHEPPYSRNAAAKLIERVKKNRSRMNNLNADLQTLINSDKDDDRKRLLDLVVGARGDIAAVQVSFEFESSEIDSDLTNMVPVTEKELEQMYGDKAPEVMAHKERMGLAKDDPNLPGSKVYQVFRDQVTTGTDQRKRCWGCNNNPTG